MRKIAELVEKIDEELEGAKNCAEMFVDYKSQNKTEWASKFKTMANDELSHAMTVHDLAVFEIERIKTVYTAPVEMQEKWDEAHKKYVEKVAWIKQMLTI